MPPGTIGKAIPRRDGAAKVTGAARYGDDHRVPGAAHAALALSTIALGSIVAIDQAAARAVPGVLEIFNHENVGKRVKAGRPLVAGGYTSSRVQPRRRSPTSLSSSSPMWWPSASLTLLN